MDAREKRIEIERIVDTIAADVTKSLRAAIKAHTTKEIPLTFLHSAVAFSVETDVQRENRDLLTVVFDVPNLTSLIELVNAINEETDQQLRNTKGNKNVN